MAIGSGQDNSTMQGHLLGCTMGGLPLFQLLPIFGAQNDRHALFGHADDHTLSRKRMSSYLRDTTLASTLEGVVGLGSLFGEVQLNSGISMASRSRTWNRTSLPMGHLISKVVRFWVAGAGRVKP